MKQYKINIESRNYDKFTFVDVKTMNQIDTVNNINPLQEKLFNYDIVTVDNNKCSLLHSTVKSSIYIPGVLVLKNNRKFGKYKQKFLYKCIPDDKRLPIFLIPYHIKNNFNKNYVNKYVIFKFKNLSNSI